MTSDDEQRLLTLATAICDGVPLDWDTLESSASSGDELGVLKNLRLVSALTGAHRTLIETEAPSPASTAVLEPALALPHWGHFALLSRLGGGSQGEVFRALDTRLDRPVALKLLKVPADAAPADSLLREARLLARVGHPNVVTVHGAELLDGRVGLWMELINGETLETAVRRGGTFSAAEAALVGADVCRAAAAVHAAGLLHRDIKAQNVMRESGGRFVLMDFGTGHDVADASQPQRSAGTPLYLAPEIFEGRAATVQSDIYSVGVLLFYLVSGQFPVRGQSVRELAAVHRAGTRTPLSEVRRDLPHAFTAVIDKALSVDPRGRFQSASAMADALAAAAAPRSHASTRPMWFAAAALALTVAGAAWWIAAGGVSPAMTASSVAVFPFDDLSGDRSLEHVGRGVSDLITTDLGQHTALRVVATRSTDAGVRQRADVARSIGVDALIEGSVRRSPAGLAISVRVVQAGVGTVLWSTTRETPLEALFEAERLLATDLAKALRSPITATAAARITPPPEALEAYFRGWQEYYGLSPNPTRLARDEFARAVALAPQFAQAQAALGYVTGLLGTSYREIPIADAIAEAERRGELARTLDPTYGYAEALLGWVRMTGHRDWAGAEAHFKRAIELNPSDPNTRSLYAQMLMANNRLEPALAEVETALQLEPLNASRHSQVAICLYYLRRFDEAIAEANLLLSKSPNAAIAHLALGRFLAEVGRFDEAAAMVRSGVNRDLPPVRAELARILYLAGKRDEADRILASLQESHKAGRLSSDLLAFVDVARGDHNSALALLRDAIQQQSPSVIWIGVDPRFDPLRTTPEFQDLVRQLHFLD